MIAYHDVIQKTPEWHALRVGMLTATAVADMNATVKTAGKEAAARRDLRIRLAVEQITGVSQESTFENDAMRHGIEKEPAGRTAYVVRSGRFVDEVGFVSHDSLKAGCSPDGVVGEFEGLLELKCPKTATHLETFRSGAVPAAYVGQCVHALWLTGARWLDFASFDDRLPEALHLFVVRMHRDEAAIAAHELLVRQFLAEVDREVEEIRALAQKAAA